MCYFLQSFPHFCESDEPKKLIQSGQEAPNIYGFQKVETYKLEETIGVVFVEVILFI